MIHNAMQIAYNNGWQAGFMWGIGCGLVLAIFIKAAKVIMKDKARSEQRLGA
jgi:hypothetical protein